MADEKGNEGAEDLDTSLEVISLNSEDLDENALEGWTVVDEDVAEPEGSHGGAPRLGPRQVSVEGISSPENFPLEETADVSEEVKDATSSSTQKEIPDATTVPEPEQVAIATGETVGEGQMEPESTEPEVSVCVEPTAGESVTVEAAAADKELQSAVASTPEENPAPHSDSPTAVPEKPNPSPPPQPVMEGKLETQGSSAGEEKAPVRELRSTTRAKAQEARGGRKIGTAASKVAKEKDDKVAESSSVDGEGVALLPDKAAAEVGAELPEVSKQPPLKQTDSVAATEQSNPPTLESAGAKVTADNAAVKKCADSVAATEQSNPPTLESSGVKVTADNAAVKKCAASPVSSSVKTPAIAKVQPSAISGSKLSKKIITTESLSKSSEKVAKESPTTKSAGKPLEESKPKQRAVEKRSRTGQVDQTSVELKTSPQSSSVPEKERTGQNSQKTDSKSLTTRNVSRRESQHDKPDSKTGKVSRRPVTASKEGVTIQSVGGKEPVEKKKLRVHRSSKATPVKSKEGKEKEDQAEGRASRLSDARKRRVSRTHQASEAPTHVTSNVYDNLEVLGQSEGPWKWELQLLKLEMSDLKDKSLEELCSAALTTHWFSMQDSETETKYGMLSLLFATMESVKAAMPLLFALKPAVRVQRIVLLRALEDTVPLKLVRVSFTLNTYCSSYLCKGGDIVTQTEFSAPPEERKKSEFIQIRGLAPDVPKEIYREMLQVFFPKALKIFLSQPSSDSWESHIQLCDMRAVNNVMRCMKGFYQNSTPLPVCDFLSPAPEEKDADLMSISSAEAFSDRDGFSAISDDNSEYSYIWSDDLSDIMSDDSFAGAEENSRFQYPLALKASGEPSSPPVETSRKSEAKHKQEPRQSSRTSSTGKGTAPETKDKALKSTPVFQKDDQRGDAAKKNPSAVSKSTAPYKKPEEKSSAKEGSVRSSRTDKEAEAGPRRERRRSPGAGGHHRGKSPSSQHPPRHPSPRRRRTPSPPRKRSRSPPRRRRSISPRRHPRSRSPERYRRSPERGIRTHGREQHHRGQRSRSRSPRFREVHHHGWTATSQEKWSRQRALPSHRQAGNTSPISSASSGSLSPPRWRHSSPMRLGKPLDPHGRPGGAGPPQYQAMGFQGAPWLPPRPGPHPSMPGMMGTGPPPLMSLSIPHPTRQPAPVPSQDRMLMEATDIQAMAREALKSLDVNLRGSSRPSGGHGAPAHPRTHSPSHSPRRSSSDRHGSPPYRSRSPVPRREREHRFSRSRSREREGPSHRESRRGRNPSPKPDIEFIVRKVVRSILGDDILESTRRDDLEHVKFVTRRVLATMEGEEHSRKVPEKTATVSSRWPHSPARAGSAERSERAPPRRPPETVGRSDDYEQEAERRIEASMHQEHLMSRGEKWDRSPSRPSMVQPGHVERDSWEESRGGSKSHVVDKHFPHSSSEVAAQEHVSRSGYSQNRSQEDLYGRQHSAFSPRHDDPYQRGSQREEGVYWPRGESSLNPSRDSSQSSGFTSHIPGLGSDKTKPVKSILKKSKPAAETQSVAPTSSSGGFWGTGTGTTSTLQGGLGDGRQGAPVQSQGLRPLHSRQNLGLDSAGSRGEEEGPKQVFDYGHLGQSQDQKMNTPFFQNQQIPQTSGDQVERNRQGKLKLEPLSRGDLEKVCDLETFKKLQVDDLKFRSYKQEFSEKTGSTRRLSFFQICDVRCIKVIPEFTHVGWSPTEQIIVPRAIRPLFVKLAHESPEGHLSQYETMDRISANFTWPTVQADVASHISSCQQCSKKATRGPLGSRGTPWHQGTGQGSAAVPTPPPDGASQSAGGAQSGGEWRAPEPSTGTGNWFNTPSKFPPSSQTTRVEPYADGSSSAAAMTPLSRSEIVKHCTWGELRESQKTDTSLQSMFNESLHHFPYNNQPGFTFTNGILFRRLPQSRTQPAQLKVVVPRKFRHGFLAAAHQGQGPRHCSLEATSSAISANYYWPTIWEDCEEFIHNCKVCNFAPY